ncbi:GNAT family N-acetyltransferase [Catalinimonas niigatensis]|uniref:GNAT family N-acetyltransferase n=1 Tax=Catalinimonas niigatensis TaxID=1397264 RepID=UPI002666D020|nr:GNAT family N-acetyltransferase [Catalinimonas niigatensis]WPP53504.1 hypothetical protein PZB72_14095 [Catalinimonas niigatensis]
MKNLKFVIAQEPDAYPMSVENYIYNDKVYLQSKEKAYGKSLSFYALSGKVAVARIHFFLIKQSNGGVEAVSIPASPFGSFEYDKGLPLQALTYFVNHIKQHLLARNADRIVIRDCIHAYRPEKNTAMPKVMEQTGFSVSDQMINHHILIDEESMALKLGRGKFRRVKECQEAGFVVQKKSIEDIEEIYTFLYQCYASKRRKLSLSLPQLREQVLGMPDCYPLFAVYDQQKMIAASVTVKVNPRILYTFYYAALSEYNYWSPTTFLLYTIYQYCQENSISIMDMGTSLSGSVAHFKAYMGGVPSSKFTYQYCI